MQKVTEWFYERAPEWLVVRGNPEETFFRFVILVVLSIAALVALFGLLIVLW